MGVAEEVMNHLPPDLDVDMDRLSLGGLSLMERLIGYDRAILIDALVSESEPGSVIVSRLEELPDTSTFHLTSIHDMSLQNAIKLGRQMGAKLPQDLTVIGISAKRIYDFREELSLPIQEAVPKAAQVVREMLMQNITIL
jgi:hydrogenase maturation protease